MRGGKGGGEGGGGVSAVDDGCLPPGEVGKPDKYDCLLANTEACRHMQLLDRMTSNGSFCLDSLYVTPDGVKQVR